METVLFVVLNHFFYFSTQLYNFCPSLKHVMNTNDCSSLMVVNNAFLLFNIVTCFNIRKGKNNLRKPLFGSTNSSTVATPSLEWRERK